MASPLSAGRLGVAATLYVPYRVRSGRGCDCPNNHCTVLRYAKCAYRIVDKAQGLASHIPSFLPSFSRAARSRSNLCSLSRSVCWARSVAWTPTRILRHLFAASHVWSRSRNLLHSDTASPSYDTECIQIQSSAVIMSSITKTIKVFIYLSRPGAGYRVCRAVLV